jgi:UDP-galactose transporter B1
VQLTIFTQSFASAILNERLVTNRYPSTPDGSEHQSSPRYFRFPIFLNTVQSLFISLTGAAYILTRPRSTYIQDQSSPKIVIVAPLLLVSLASMLGARFANMSLTHVNYTALIIAKSCMLLPVMALNIIILQKRYPVSRYLLVTAISAGATIFTMNSASSGVSGTFERGLSNATYGLCLLGLGLLLDGSTFIIQEHVFNSPDRYGKFEGGPQMMVAQNAIVVAFNAGYLMLLPLLPSSILAPFVATETQYELSAALAFTRRHPLVVPDILGFALCNSIAQLFIFAAFDGFSSLLHVNIRVTKKMLSILLSIAWFDKSLSLEQWFGVTLVVAAIALEGWMKVREEKKPQNHSNLSMKESVPSPLMMSLTSSGINACITSGRSTRDIGISEQNMKRLEMAGTVLRCEPYKVK